MKKYLPLLFAAISTLAACNSKSKSSGDSDASSKVTTIPAESPKQTVAGTAGTDEYTIAVPQGWEQKEQQMKNYRMLILLAPKEDNYQPNVTVLKDDMRGNNIDEYIKINLKQMEPMHIKLEKTGELDIDGIKGKYMTYTYDYQGRDVSIKSYILPKNNVAYILTGSSLVSQTDKMRPVFDETANTFKLK